MVDRDAMLAYPSNPAKGVFFHYSFGTSADCGVLMLKCQLNVLEN